MAQLTPSLRIGIAWSLLSMRLGELHLARHAALDALLRSEGEIEDRLRQQLRLSKDDPFPDADPDDPEDPLHDLYDDASENSAQSRSAAALTRKAFTIVLFHLWERHCTATMKTKRYDHDEVVAWLAAIGKPLRDAAGLRALELACHCTKHGPGNSCGKLWDLRPDLFPSAHTSESASDRNLIIGDETLDAFYNLVATI